MMTNKRGGKRLGAGRPKKVITVVKDWIKEHPMAVSELMAVLYEKGIEGDRECAMYVIDRIKGKPKAPIGIDEEDRGLITASMVIEFRKLIDKEVEGTYELIGGEDATERPREEEGSQQGQTEEA